METKSAFEPNVSSGHTWVTELSLEGDPRLRSPTHASNNCGRYKEMVEITLPTRGKLHRGS